MSENNIKYYIGKPELKKCTLPVYSDIVCDFLNDLSKNLRNNASAKKYPDVLTFAYWCRKGNIAKLKEDYGGKLIRVGKGLAFHIAPSNVPINFAFSLVFGLLSGNSNVVRVSTKEFEQVKVVCDAINELLNSDEYKTLADYITVVSYEHSKTITDYYSANCMTRIIWGGDATIEAVRQSPLAPRANEITFADRYSFAIFDEKALENATDAELDKLASGFYNDTYLMDQNACSSPHMIAWIPFGNGLGRKKFWATLEKTSTKYDLTAKKSVDKYMLACELAANGVAVKYESKTNYLMVAHLPNLPEKMEDIRGKFGLFFECNIDNVEEILGLVTNRVQTMVTYGLDNTEVAKKVVKAGCSGIDRIVEPGQAMDIGIIWDGMDVIGNMSRIVKVG